MAPSPVAQMNLGDISLEEVRDVIQQAHKRAEKLRVQRQRKRERLEQKWKREAADAGLALKNVFWESVPLVEKKTRRKKVKKTQRKKATKKK